MAGGRDEILGSLMSIEANLEKMCSAIEELARTHAKAEERFRQLESRLYDCHDKALGKGQIPIVSHFIILGSVVLVSVLGVLYVTEHSIKATLTSIDIERGH